MDKNHRDVFFNLLLGIQLLYHEAMDTDNEGQVGHIMLELLSLSDLYGADKGEILGIMHNAGLEIQGKPLLNIDEYIQQHKLLDILQGTDFVGLVYPPADIK